MYSLNFILFITGAHSTNSVRMTGGRRQASDAVHSHVIGALELNFHQGGWCRIFNFNLMNNVKFNVNFARARRLRRRTRAPGGLAPPYPPRGRGSAKWPNRCRERHRRSTMQIGWAGGQKFFSKPYFFRANLQTARPNETAK